MFVNWNNKRLLFFKFQNKFNSKIARKVAVKKPNDDAALIVEYELLQLAVEQHAYVIPVPLTVVLVGHVDVSAHE
jgi:hypothetical protein